MNYPKETHELTKQEILLERVPGWKAVGYGNPGELLSSWLKVLGFMVMVLVSRLSLADHSGLEFFLVVHALLS